MLRGWIRASSGMKTLSVMLGAFVISTVLFRGVGPASAGGSETPAPVTDVRNVKDLHRALDMLPPSAQIRVGGSVITVQAARDQVASQNALVKRVSTLPLASTAWSKRPLSDLRANASAARSGPVTGTAIAPISGSDGNITQYAPNAEVTYLPAPALVVDANVPSAFRGWNFGPLPNIEVLNFYCPGASLCEMTDPALIKKYTKSGHAVNGPCMGDGTHGWGSGDLCAISRYGSAREHTWRIDAGQQLVSVEEIGCNPQQFHVHVDTAEADKSDKKSGSLVHGSIDAVTDVLAVCRVRIGVTKH